jgi:hypothetical protein
MIAVQMADEDMIYLPHPDVVPAQLHLGSLTAVN